MGLSYSFMDNEVYGAEDINLMMSKLTTQGVSLFKYSDGDNPLIALNEAVASIASPGVEMYNTQSCVLEYNQSGKYIIAPGNAFMFDGTCATIDGDGYDITDAVNELRLNSQEDIYVSFYRNIPDNRIDILVLPEEETKELDNSVLIGKIQSNGKVVDLREIAVSKIAPSSGNIVNIFDLDILQITRTEGAKRLKMTFDNVFTGAKYVQFTRLQEIQRVNTTTGDELVFNKISGVDLYVAYNLVGTQLQFWAYTSSGVELVGGKMIVF